MKFYATKYWSTKGIIEFEGEVYEEKYASERLEGGRWRMFLRIGKDAFTDLEEAKADVERKAHTDLHSKEKALKKSKELLRKAVAREIKVVKT